MGQFSRADSLVKRQFFQLTMKHDQIMSTGASILVTSCQNGLSQFADLKARYEPPLEVKSVIELLVDAME